jgi:hypothetical protein
MAVEWCILHCLPPLRQIEPRSKRQPLAKPLRPAAENLVDPAANPVHTIIPLTAISSAIVRETSEIDLSYSNFFCSEQKKKERENGWISNWYLLPSVLESPIHA